MTKKEYFVLLKSNGLMNKTELELTEENKNKENTFIEKVPKATGNYEEKLYKYEYLFTDDDMDKIIKLKQLSCLDTIAGIMIGYVILTIIGVIILIINVLA